MSKLRTYSVGYWVEQGYAITVEAKSAKHAERIVRQRLDDHIDRLPKSERVHHDDGVSCVTLVKRGAP